MCSAVLDRLCLTSCVDPKVIDQLSLLEQGDSDGPAVLEQGCQGATEQGCSSNKGRPAVLEQGLYPSVVCAAVLEQWRCLIGMVRVSGVLNWPHLTISSVWGTQRAAFDHF